MYNRTNGTLFRILKSYYKIYSTKGKHPIIGCISISKTSKCLEIRTKTEVKRKTIARVGDIFSVKLFFLTTSQSILFIGPF